MRDRSVLSLPTALTFLTYITVAIPLVRQLAPIVPDILILHSSTALAFLTYRPLALPFVYQLAPCVTDCLLLFTASFACACHIALIIHIIKPLFPLDLRKQLADFERLIKPMGDTIPIGQLICMALRYRSDQKGYPQLALQSL
jgi:hypothetical protein